MCSISGILNHRLSGNMRGDIPWESTITRLSAKSAYFFKNYKTILSPASSKVDYSVSDDGLDAFLERHFKEGEVIDKNIREVGINCLKNRALFNKNEESRKVLLAFSTIEIVIGFVWKDVSDIFRTQQTLTFIRPTKLAQLSVDILKRFPESDRGSDSVILEVITAHAFLAISRELCQFNRVLFKEKATAV